MSVNTLPPWGWGGFRDNLVVSLGMSVNTIPPTHILEETQRDYTTVSEHPPLPREGRGVGYETVS